MMGCTHPFGVEELRDAEGELLGIRCPACGATSMVGESFWAGVRRTFLEVFWRRR